jgi:Lrp/AsnC family transcriptional regulator, cysteine-sensing transcriptional activator
MRLGPAFSRVHRDRLPRDCAGLDESLCSQLRLSSNTIAQIQRQMIEILCIWLELEAEMLDELDRKILATLQVDASLSMQQVAERVGLSSTPCWRRIQKLEQSGYIKRRVALLDAEKLNLGVSVFIAVKTNQHNAEWVQKFRKIVVGFPEVVDFYRLSGDVDYLIRAVVSDIRAYDDLYQRLIAKIDLHDVSSMFTMEQIKSTTELPLMNA